MNEFRDSSTLTRARVTAVYDDGEHQFLDLAGFSGEKFTRVQRHQAHGMSSHPPVGAVGLFARLGESERLVSLGFETADRQKNTVAGGSVLYDAAGNVIYAKMADGISVEAKNGKAVVKRGDMTVTVAAGRVDLGGEGGPAVLTTSGPSSKVFAII